MKEFKKWSRINPYSSPGVERAWRAALEWLQSEEAKSQHYITGDLMRQELEDTACLDRDAKEHHLEG